MNSLSAIKVSKKFGDHWILKEASCVIEQGKITAIVGPSGSGKTTLLRILSFLDAPDEGEVLLNTSTHEALNEGHPWPQVTCVFQKQFLWPHLTIRQNIELPLLTSRTGGANTSVDEIISMFAIGPFAERYPNEVSGGEAQRGALARAFALAPKIILLDEAHTFLDLEQQATLNRYLISLKEKGIGIAVVTHSLEFVRKFADQVLVVESGGIAESGSVALLQQPNSNYLKRSIIRNE